jgi:uncharacterized protein YegP (UPF0339 family)
MSDRTEVYKDSDGEWRWKRIAGNGEIIATGESHGSKRDAERAAARVFAPVDGLFRHYTSTYCIHLLHDQCRLTCKHCASQCLCKCHSMMGNDLDESRTEQA